MSDRNLTIELASGEWIVGGAPAGDALGEARLQAHYAAQLISAAADALLPRKDDDSQSNLEWDPVRRVLLTRAKGELCLGLELDALNLLLINPPEPELCLPLAGRTIAEALAWLGEGLRTAKLLPPATPLDLRDYGDMPAHAVADGAAFQPPTPALAELANWFSSGQHALEAVGKAFPRTSELRCWPHHFDLGSLIELESGTIGIGLSPGDTHYAEPYFYVSPYPQPTSDALPELASGAHWHTAGFVSAILPATELTQGPQLVGAYLSSALTACSGLLTD